MELHKTLNPKNCPGLTNDNSTSNRNYNNYNNYD